MLIYSGIKKRFLMKTLNMLGSLRDETISRDSLSSQEALNDYQEASDLSDGGIVWSM